MFFQILPLMCSLQWNYDLIRNWEIFEPGQLTVCKTTDVYYIRGKTCDPQVRAIFGPGA